MPLPLRASFDEMLQKDEAATRDALLSALEQEFPGWMASLRVATERFDQWLTLGVSAEMGRLSRRHQADFVAPIASVSRQLSQALQDFRNRLNERALSTLGVPLQMSEIDLRAPEPGAPHVRVGKIFDRNWELVSFLLPMWAIRRIVKKHFQRKVANVIFVNLSRLAGQWEDVVDGAIFALEKDALRRLG
jgi:hypothetical protein